MAASSWRSVAFGIAMVIHVIICPYTKVEESFNMQAIHDVHYNNMNIEKYDHRDFPGVVPRTFIGAVTVGVVSSPFNFLIQMTNFNKNLSQIIARICLGLMTAMSFAVYRRAVAKVLSPSVANILTLFTVTQFHFMFYASRTLPNTFALILALPALGYWLENKLKRFIWLSAFAAIIFRSELCLLVGPLLMIGLLRSKIDFLTAMMNALMAGFAALAVTIAVDSLFWGRLLWPEGVVLYYNTILNKSSNWGTSPFLWYFSSAIPRCLLFVLPFVPFGIFSKDKNLAGLLFSTFFFVFLYSFLPHKELRFIIYAIPVLNTSAAAGVLQVFRWTRNHSLISKMWYLGLVLLMLGNLSATGLLSYISHHNYPGGVAFSRLHGIVDKSQNISVHIDNLAAQTGVTRFGELNSHWRYSKEENIDASSPELQNFTHLIREAPCSAFSNTHDVMSVIVGFHKMHFNFKSLKEFFHVDILEKLCILQRKDVNIRAY